MKMFIFIKFFAIFSTCYKKYVTKKINTSETHNLLSMSSSTSHIVQPTGKPYVQLKSENLSGTAKWAEQILSAVDEQKQQHRAHHAASYRQHEFIKFQGSELNILNSHASSITYIFTRKMHNYFSVHVTISTFYMLFKLQYIFLFGHI